MTASRLLTAGAVAALLQIGVAMAQSPQPEQGAQPTQPTHPAMPQQGDTPQQTPPPEQGGQPSKPTHPAVEGGHQKGVTFESLDKDSDGRISKTEAEADAKVSQQFTMYDKNGNGYIEREEVMSSNTPPDAPKQ